MNFPLAIGSYSTTHLILRVEINPVPPIKRNITQEARPIPAPREHRQRDRDGHVDPNLANFDTRLELARGRAALRENCGAVTVLVGVDDVERVIEGVGGDDGENGAKDLLAEYAQLLVLNQKRTDRGGDKPVASHVSRGFEHGRPDPVSIRIVLDLEVATIERDLSAFLLRRGDQADDSLLGGGRDDRSEVGVLRETLVDTKL